jgi:hypothetical protein
MPLSRRQLKTGQPSLSQVLIWAFLGVSASKGPGLCRDFQLYSCSSFLIADSVVAGLHPAYKIRLLFKVNLNKLPPKMGALLSGGGEQ